MGQYLRVILTREVVDQTIKGVKSEHRLRLPLDRKEHIVSFEELNLTIRLLRHDDAFSEGVVCINDEKIAFQSGDSNVYNEFIKPSLFSVRLEFVEEDYGAKALQSYCLLLRERAFCDDGNESHEETADYRFDIVKGASLRLQKCQADVDIFAIDPTNLKVMLTIDGEEVEVTSSRPGSYVRSTQTHRHGRCVVCSKEVEIRMVATELLP